MDPKDLENTSTVDPGAAAHGLVPDPGQETPEARPAEAVAVKDVTPSAPPEPVATAAAEPPPPTATPEPPPAPAAPTNPDDQEYDLRELGKMKYSDIRQMRDFATEAWQQREAFKQAQAAFAAQQSEIAERQKHLETLGSLAELADFNKQLGPNAPRFMQTVRDVWAKVQSDPQDHAMYLAAQNAALEKRLIAAEAWQKTQEQQRQNWVAQQERAQAEAGATAAFKSEYGKDPTPHQVAALVYSAGLPANAAQDRRFLMRSLFGAPVAAPSAPPPRVAGLGGSGAPRAKHPSERTKDEDDNDLVARMRRAGMPI